MNNYNPYYQPQASGIEDFSQGVGDAQLGLQAFQASGGNPYVMAGVLGLKAITGGIEIANQEKDYIDQIRNMQTATTSTGFNNNPLYNEFSSSSDIANLQTNQVGRANLELTDITNPIGAISKIGSSIIGGRKRRGKAREAKRKALIRLGNAQESFNTANLDYANTEIGKMQSNKNMYDRQRRMYNIPTQLY